MQKQTKIEKKTQKFDEIYKNKIPYQNLIKENIKLRNSKKIGSDSKITNFPECFSPIGSNRVRFQSLTYIKPEFIVQIKKEKKKERKNKRKAESSFKKSQIYNEITNFEEDHDKKGIDSSIVKSKKSFAIKSLANSPNYRKNDQGLMKKDQKKIFKYH